MKYLLGDRAGTFALLVLLALIEIVNGFDWSTTATFAALIALNETWRYRKVRRAAEILADLMRENLIISAKIRLRIWKDHIGITTPPMVPFYRIFAMLRRFTAAQLREAMWLAAKKHSELEIIEHPKSARMPHGLLVLQIAGAHNAAN